MSLQSTLRRRFEMKVLRTDDCWLWQGAKWNNGYGVIAFDTNRTKGAHVVSYLLYVGPVPDGYEVDHLCFVRHCVNPAHLEAVPKRVNQDRVFWKHGTKCKHGHDRRKFTKTNANGARICTVCAQNAVRRHRGRPETERGRT